MAGRRARDDDDDGPVAKRGTEMVTLYTGTTSGTLAGMERYGYVASKPPSLVGNEKLLELRLAPRTGELSTLYNHGVSSKSISTSMVPKIAFDYATGKAAAPMDLWKELQVIFSAGTDAKTAVFRRIEIALLRLMRYATEQEVMTVLRANGIERNMSEILDDLDLTLDGMYDATWEFDGRLSYVGTVVKQDPMNGMRCGYFNEMGESIRPPHLTEKGTAFEENAAPSKIGQIVLHSGTGEYTHGIVTEIFQGRRTVVFSQDDSKIFETAETKFYKPITAEVERPNVVTKWMQSYMHKALRPYLRLRELISHVRGGTVPFELSVFELDPFPVLFELQVNKHRLKEISSHFNPLAEYPLEEVVLTRDVVRISVPADRIWQVRAWVDHHVRASRYAGVVVDNKYFGGSVSVLTDVMHAVII